MNIVLKIIKLKWLILNYHEYNRLKEKTFFNRF